MGLAGRPSPLDQARSRLPWHIHTHTPQNTFAKTNIHPSPKIPKPNIGLAGKYPEHLGGHREKESVWVEEVCSLEESLADGSDMMSLTQVDTDIQ